MANENSFQLDKPASPAVWDNTTDEQKKATGVGWVSWPSNGSGGNSIAVSTSVARRCPPSSNPGLMVLRVHHSIPHNRQSRSQKWLRATPAKGHVTIWWSHGWGKILGYHAEGVVIGAFKRDVIGLTPAGEKYVYRRAEDWLRNKIKSETPAKPEPPKSAKPDPKSVRTPMRRVQAGVVNVSPSPSSRQSSVARGISLAHERAESRFADGSCV